MKHLTALFSAFTLAMMFFVAADNVQAGEGSVRPTLPSPAQTISGSDRALNFAHNLQDFHRTFQDFHFGMP